MFDVSSGTLISRKNDVLATEVDGETVLMDVASGKYFGLARTAHAVWSALETPKTFQELCDLLQSRYSGSAELILADTRRFVLELADRRLVALS